MSKFDETQTFEFGVDEAFVLELDSHVGSRIGRPLVTELVDLQPIPLVNLEQLIAITGSKVRSYFPLSLKNEEPENVTRA